MLKNILALVGTAALLKVAYAHYGEFQALKRKKPSEKKPQPRRRPIKRRPQDRTSRNGRRERDGGTGQINFFMQAGGLPCPLRSIRSPAIRSTSSRPKKGDRFIYS